MLCVADCADRFSEHILHCLTALCALRPSKVYYRLTCRPAVKIVCRMREMMTSKMMMMTMMS